MSCPVCPFPIHEDQPQLRVHMGVIRDAEGYIVDLLPVFHRPCAARYLIELGRAKTAAQSGRRTAIYIAEKEILKVA